MPTPGARSWHLPRVGWERAVPSLRSDAAEEARREQPSPAAAGLHHRILLTQRASSGRNKGDRPQTRGGPSPGPQRPDVSSSRRQGQSAGLNSWDSRRANRGSLIQSASDLCPTSSCCGAVGTGGSRCSGFAGRVSEVFITPLGRAWCNHIKYRQNSTEELSSTGGNNCPDLE